MLEYLVLLWSRLQSLNDSPEFGALRIWSRFLVKDKPPEGGEIRQFAKIFYWRTCST